MSSKQITITETLIQTCEKAHLVVLLGANSGRSFPITKDVIIGRSTEADIRLDARGISRKHLNIRRVENEQYWVQDLNSKNGTQINGIPVSQDFIHFGDKILLGEDTVLLFTRYEPLEEQLIHLQKMQSMGKLSVGISHDFNNLLGVVISSLEYLSNLPSATDQDEHEIEECLQDAIQASQRAVELTKQLLGFAYQGEAEIDRVEVTSIIYETAKLVRRTFEQAIEVVIDVPSELYIKGNITHLMQVLMNLCVNARDAMPNGGRLTLKARHAELDELNPTLSYPLDPYVVIMVNDTGVGMDEETCSRIFEPFFTTKSTRGGSGMGLSTVFNIVRNHGGQITVDSRPERGTTFRIYLPSAKVKSATKATMDLDSYETHEGKWFADIPIHVLLVDDELLVLRSTERILSRAGYRVHTARTGNQALAIYEQFGEKIKVVLLDLNLPENKGEEIFKSLKQMDEQVKVLIFSGCWDERRIRSMLQEGALGFISKPADTEALTRALVGVLADGDVGPIRRKNF